MQNKKRITRYRLLLCLVMQICLFGTASSADYTIDDEYMQNLSAEADKLEYMDEAQKELQESMRTEKQAPAGTTSEQMQTALSSSDNFAHVLSVEYPFSYQLYKNLDNRNKQEVFRTLKTSRKFSAAKRKIIELYKIQIN